MNTRMIIRVLASSALLLNQTGCSDSTQFAEKTLPGSFDAAKVGEETTSTQPEQTDPESQTGANPDGSVTNEDSPTGISPSGAVTSETQPNSGPAVNPTPSPGPGTGGGAGSSGPNVAGPVPPGEVFSECSAHPDMAIVSQLYQLPPNTDRLPDFSALRSIGDVCVAQLNIADREFTFGFPGVSDIFEWFALDMRFKLNITRAGNYQFYVNSDDGSILSIDNSVVVNNDGTHAQIEKSGSIYLGVGVHDVQVRYYQGPRTRIALELFWKVPGSNSKVYVPKSVMQRP
jgi:hypothetical protein